jgi:hypothetical protein
VESAFDGILEAGDRVCVGAFGRNLASVAVKTFPHLISFIKTSYTFVASEAFSKDDITINCINI